jgi:hypothetical protein
MSVVQDFRFSWKLPNPMVHYKIHNIVVDLPLDDFYAAIRVPQWCGKIKDRPKPLLELYKEICQGRSFSEEMVKSEAFNFPLFGILLILLLGNMPVRCDGREK